MARKLEDQGRYVNAYSQEVIIDQITESEVVFVWLHDDSVDVMDIDEFKTYFKKV